MRVLSQMEPMSKTSVRAPSVRPEEVLNCYGLHWKTLTHTLDRQYDSLKVSNPAQRPTFFSFHRHRANNNTQVRNALFKRKGTCPFSKFLSYFFVSFLSFSFGLTSHFPYSPTTPFFHHLRTRIHVRTWKAKRYTWISYTTPHLSHHTIFLLSFTSSNLTTSSHIHKNEHDSPGQHQLRSSGVCVCTSASARVCECWTRDTKHAIERKEKKRREEWKAEREKMREKSGRTRRRTRFCDKVSSWDQEERKNNVYSRRRRRIPMKNVPYVRIHPYAFPHFHIPILIRLYPLLTFGGE